MRYAAAYVLATLAGNTNPDTGSISKILSSVGIDCDQSQAQKVIDACKGKNLEQIIAEGTKKISSLPVGGAAAGGSAAAAPAKGAADAKKGAAKEEPKKEEKKKDDSDEEGDDMVCISTCLRRPLVYFQYHFRVLVYLIRLYPIQCQSSSNIFQANAHHQHSYLLRLFLFMCVLCESVIGERKKRKEGKK